MTDVFEQRRLEKDRADREEAVPSDDSAAESLATRPDESVRVLSDPSVGDVARDARERVGPEVSQTERELAKRGGESGTADAGKDYTRPGSAIPAEDPRERAERQHEAARASASREAMAQPRAPDELSAAAREQKRRDRRLR
ncbi:MAG TPA: hypothetical protein VM681_08590 [Candidatus Thermoplasmatota archaeon]|nr:hypothetical protein [Candidatus Thermoplasmatota archaeon]